MRFLRILFTSKKPSECIPADCKVGSGTDRKPAPQESLLRTETWSGLRIPFSSAKPSAGD